jgi:hypothetical protein
MVDLVEVLTLLTTAPRPEQEMQVEMIQMQIQYQRVILGEQVDQPHMVEAVVLDNLVLMDRMMEMLRRAQEQQELLVLVVMVYSFLLLLDH